MWHPFEYIYSDYGFQGRVPNELGRGGFGLVCEAVQNSTFSPVAIKRVPLCHTEWRMQNRIPEQSRILPLAFDDKRVTMVAREILNQNACEGFPYVAQLLDCYRSQDGFDAYLVLEKWPVNLLQYIRQPTEFKFRGHKLSVAQTPRVIMCQLLIAVDFLHRKNIFHRDISLGNVFVDASSGKVCLGDFGSSKVVNEGCDPPTDGLGTLPYKAPEVLCECKANPQLRWAADIWSLACVFMELLTAKPFIHAKEPDHQLVCWLRVLNEANPSNLRRLMANLQCPIWCDIFLSSDDCKRRLETQHNTEQNKIPTLAERLEMMTPILRGRGAPANDDTTATVQLVKELLPAMLVLDPAQRLPASELLKKGGFAEDPLCQELLTEYQQWQARKPNQMPTVPDSIDPAILAAFTQWDPVSRILLRPRTADASIALPARF
jgi:serine/threonine protein kinase